MNFFRKLKKKIIEREKVASELKEEIIALGNTNETLKREQGLSSYLMEVLIVEKTFQYLKLKISNYLLFFLFFLFS